MSLQPQSTSAAIVWLGTTYGAGRFKTPSAPSLLAGGGGSTAKMFATGKNGVEIEPRPAYVPLMNDLAGPVVPFDQCQVGADYIVSFVATIWDEAMHKTISSLTGGGSPQGKEAPLDRGSLMLHEGLVYPLWVTYPMAGTLAYPDLPPCYHFFAAMIISPKRMSPGVKPYEVQFTFHCMPVYQAGGGGFIAYDDDMSGVTANLP